LVHWGVEFNFFFFEMSDRVDDNATHGGRPRASGESPRVDS